MSESIPDLRGVSRREAYATIKASVNAVLSGVNDEVAAMATIAALVHHSLGFLWTGFYRVVAPNLLQVGPYQGSLGCIDIEFGRGVCGTAAQERKTSRFTPAFHDMASGIQAEGVTEKDAERGFPPEGSARTHDERMPVRPRLVLAADDGGQH